MRTEEAVEILSKELGISKEVISKAYNSYWLFVRTTIKELPLKEGIFEDEFKKLRTSFNIPSIGKLYCDYDVYHRRHNLYKNFKEILGNESNKEDKTDVHVISDDM